LLQLFSGPEEVIPIIVGFNFGVREFKDKQEWDAPERIPSQIVPASVDVWDFGNMICEALRLFSTFFLLIFNRFIEFFSSFYHLLLVDPNFQLL